MIPDSSASSRLFGAVLLALSVFALLGASARPCTNSEVLQWSTRDRVRQKSELRTSRKILRGARLRRSDVEWVVSKRGRVRRDYSPGGEVTYLAKMVGQRARRDLPAHTVVRADDFQRADSLIDAAGAQAGFSPRQVTVSDWNLPLESEALVNVFMVEQGKQRTGELLTPSPSRAVILMGELGLFRCSGEDDRVDVVLGLTPDVAKQLDELRALRREPVIYLEAVEGTGNGPVRP